MTLLLFFITYTVQCIYKWVCKLFSFFFIRVSRRYIQPNVLPLMCGFSFHLLYNISTHIRLSSSCINDKNDQTEPNVTNAANYNFSHFKSGVLLVFFHCTNQRNSSL